MIICEVLKGRTEKFLQEFLSTVGYKYYYWITDRGLIRKDTIEGDGTYQYLDYLFCKENLSSISNKIYADDLLVIASKQNSNELGGNLDE